MSKFFLTIIVVNWNGIKWLKKCIDSLISQTNKNFEIIIVDNSSTDDSINFIKSNYPNIKILNSKNLGFGHACNVGASNAKGDFLMFFNEDMYVDDDFIENYSINYKKIPNKKNVGTIGCNIAEYDKSKINEDSLYGFGIDPMGAPFPNFNSDRIFHNTGCPLFISKNLFLKIKGFCENIFLYGEDIDICWRLNVFGYKHYFFQNIYIYHNCGVGTFSEKKLSLYIRGEINSLFNNLSPIFLLFSLLYLFIFYFILSLVYLFSGKTNFTKTIISTIFNEIKNNLTSIIRFRHFVQKNRQISDFSLLNRICPLPSRLTNLLYVKYYKKLKNENYLLKHLLKLRL